MFLSYAQAMCRVGAFLSPWFLAVLICAFPTAGTVWADDKPPPANASLDIKAVQAPAGLTRMIQQELGKEYPPLPGDPGFSFRAEAVDLNNDQQPEWMILNNPDSGKPFCTAHNCRVLIFGRKGSSYQLLLKGYAGAMHPSPIPLVSVHEGHYDVMTIEHASALEHVLTVYTFQKRRYRIGRCYLETSQGDGRKAEIELCEECPGC